MMSDKKQEEFDPGLFDAAFAASTSKFSEGRGQKKSPGVPRQYVDLEVPTKKMPNENFRKADKLKVTIQTLTSRQELAAARKSGNDGTKMGYLMALESVVAVNGRELEPGNAEKEWFWEAIGPAGRQYIASAYGELASPSQDDLGKMRETLTYR